MEERDSEVPLPKGKPVVGIIYNLKHQETSEDIPDAEAEYDNIETVYAIKNSLEVRGLKTVLVEADRDFTEKLRGSKIDIAFNIAEGINGRGREAQVPAILDMLGIPFTGSDATTLCIALDKALTKRVLSTYRIRTPKSALISKDGRRGAARLIYPVIVKPNAEGSSKGIFGHSVVESAEELDALVRRNIGIYGGEMLAEEYISGREFTVGILGNGGEAKVFPPMEIIYKRDTQGHYRVYSYDVKQNYKEYVLYECPAKLDKKVNDEIISAAKKIFSVLGCRDFTRIDFRISNAGIPYFIEINPLPGLAPGYSDYPMLAEFCGVSYDELVYGVLSAAAARCGIEI
ncbi:MAG: ATP-grasp domain-containing protein [Oscillospiraceae bacterium]